MEIKRVTKEMVHDYMDFCKKIYKDNPYYRDNLSMILRSILTGKAHICKGSFIAPIMAVQGKEIVAVCILAIVDRMKETLQITFFEALANQQQAVDEIIDYAIEVAKGHPIKNISVGLNFHVNYGLGLLADQYESVPSFGSSYNPPYYIDYFKGYNHQTIHLISYLTKMKDFDLPVDGRLLHRIRSKYTVRRANFKNIKEEAAIYTYINNHAFKNHLFYYERRPEEDLELFNEFKLFLKEENLLFLEYEGNPIGFMLWYPDFNQLIPRGHSMGLTTLIKSKLFGHKIKKFKIVELGVLPEFQNRGAVLALFDTCKKITQDRYTLCESGWILEDNLASKGFGLRWAHQEYKHYQAFLIPVKEGTP